MGQPFPERPIVGDVIPAFVAIVDRRADGLSFNSSDWAEKKMWRTLA
jgi:hypothetical protein